MPLLVCGPEAELHRPRAAGLDLRRPRPAGGSVPAPEDHALGLVRFACPGICPARIRLPYDEVRWHWDPSGQPAQMRAYFAPATARLEQAGPPPGAGEAHVSVSRSQAFVGRSVVRAYVTAWLAQLEIETAQTTLSMGTPSATIEFSAGRVGGQLLLDDAAAVADLLHFAGLEPALAQVAELVRLDLDSPAQDPCDVREEGIYLRLSPREHAGGEDS